MIAFLKGTIVDIEENKVIIEVNNMGYNVFVTSRDIGNIGSTGTTVTLYTYLQVREDAMQLYGFLSKEDRKVFTLLIGVNGVGPKAALSVLSVLSATELRFAVLAQDAKAIAKAPGIGNKTAQKLILELKDKFDLMETFEESFTGSEPTPVSVNKGNMDEAVQALVALGYGGTESLKAVRSVTDAEKLSTEEILKAALKKMIF